MFPSIDDSKGGAVAALYHHTRALFGDRAGRAGSAAALVLQEESCLFEAAAALGLQMTHPYVGRKPDAGGQEHSVYFCLETQQVIKLNHAGTWGLSPGYVGLSGPLRYLERMLLTEIVFGFPWQVWGVVRASNGKPQILSYQPVAEGQFASQEQIDRFLAEGDFEEYQRDAFSVPAWLQRESGIVIEDLFPDNLMVEELENGEWAFKPFDIPIGLLHQ